MDAQQQGNTAANAGQEDYLDKGKHLPRQRYPIHALKQPVNA